MNEEFHVGDIVVVELTTHTNMVTAIRQINSMPHGTYALCGRGSGQQWFLITTLRQASEEEIGQARYQHEASR
jgi:hypothetical protein